MGTVHGYVPPGSSEERKIPLEISLKVRKRTPLLSHYRAQDSRLVNFRGQPVWERWATHPPYLSLFLLDIFLSPSCSVLIVDR